MPELDLRQTGSFAVARASCEQIFSRFLASIDQGRPTESLGVFTADAVIEVGSAISTGLVEIEATLAARESATSRATLHMVSVFDFELTASDDATARGGLALYAGPPGDLDTSPESLAHYALRFRRPERAWKISHYEVKICGQVSAR